MPDWQKIINQLKADPRLNSAWDTIKRAGKASESPAGFGTIAALGLSAVIYINLPGTLPDTYIADDNTPEVLEPPQKAESHPTAEPVTLDDPAPVPEEETFQLRRRETLIGLLNRARIQNSNAHNAVNALGKVTNLRKLKAGQNISLTRRADDNKAIGELRIRDTFNEEAIVLLRDGDYEAKREPITTYALTDFVEGEITDSLYLSAQRAGMPTKVIVDLIRLMSFDVDFEREIRVGDHFEVYYARDYSPGFDDVENGRILRAKLTLQKRELDAFFFKEKDGSEGYFDAGGKSTRRALMKTPLDVAVITSSYGRRKHPVLGYTRMHKGADFRAPTGTPIMAAGDGIIEMSARNGSYGNYVRIRHNGTYKTAYAHLSRYGKGVKKGRRVKQGQIIGYSGATGRVNGPHLHYEVLINGKQTNPMTLKLPTGRTLKGEDKKIFEGQTTALLQDLEKVRELKTILFAQQGGAKTEIKSAR